MKFDHLVLHVGQFGKYQKQLYFILCLPMLICALHKLVWVFIGATPKHRCRLPEDEIPFDSRNLYFLPSAILNRSIPWDERKGIWNTCEMYNSSIDAKFEEDVTRFPCDSWVYEIPIEASTAVTDFNLVCNNAWLTATVQSLQMAGEFVGSMLWGVLSDRFGRKVIFCLGAVLQTGFGLLTSFAVNYSMLVACRFMVGFSTPGVSFTSYVIMMEFVGPSKRALVGITSQYFFALGYFVIAGAAYFLPSWRYLQFTMSLFGVLMIVSLWFVPESVRWLLTQNRRSKAYAIVKKIAAVNQVTLPENLIIDDSSSQAGPDETLITLMKQPKLRKRAFNAMFCWFVNTCVYYGLSLNTPNLGGNSFINFAISGAVEIPSYTLSWICLDRIGRRRLISFSLLIAGLSLIAIVFVPEDMITLIIVMAMFGKFAATVSYATIYMYTTEMFPTSTRTAAFAMCSTSGRIGAIVAPFFVYLGRYWSSLPLLVYGSLSFSSGFLSLFFPETLNKNLPETVQEGIHLSSAVSDVNSDSSDPDHIGES